jgi:hypothetical protein
MNKQTQLPSTEPELIDEAWMEKFSNDQLAYKAWIGTDLAQEILFDDGACEGSLQDAKYETAFACTALRVLVRRLTGMDPDALRVAVQQRQLEALVLCPDVEQMPAPETVQ